MEEIDLLTIIFRAASCISLGFGLYFVIIKKRFWFPTYPLIVFSLIFAAASKREWELLLTKVVPLAVIYLLCIPVVIYLKKLKKKEE